MRSKEWINLISTEFNVSYSMAKKMYHRMLREFELYKAVGDGRKDKISGRSGTGNNT